MATKKTSTAKAASAKDPRTSASTTPPAATQGAVTQTHETHANISGRRKLDEAEPKPKKSEMVTVTIPRRFNLQVNVHGAGTQIVTYEPGTDEMPREHAEHQYSIDNGVEIVE